MEYNYSRGDSMYDDFFYERLTKLRMTKGVSQREMSLSMGQSEGYMTKIESKVSLPSMTVFFYICDYFGIHPKDFFNDEKENPEILQAINNDLNKLSDEQLLHIAAVINDIAAGNKP